MEGFTMWVDAILNISVAIGEAIFSTFLGKSECKKFQKRLEKISHERFESFADSSLDKDDFYRFIQSEEFKVILRNFYFTISDGRPKNDYLTYICKVAEANCPSSDYVDIRRFFSQIDELFCTELHNIIKNNKELSALLAILTVSNRTIIQKISESEDNLVRYLKSVSKEINDIDDELIKLYHHHCEEEFSMINFSGIVDAETKKARTLEELYVENHFHIYSKEYNYDFSI
jgi:hypothetical protein